ncbi:MAG TPA: DUF4168 domain-containing protein [Candidatus Binatia bacterium]
MTPWLQRFFFGAALVAAGLPSAPPADAGPSSAAAAAEKEISDKDLQKFAKAYVEYRRIKETYETRMNKVPDAKAREKIQREGDAKVNQALARQGLTSDSYSRLFTAVNGNERLRQKALKYIEEERKRS